MDPVSTQPQCRRCDAELIGEAEIATQCCTPCANGVEIERPPARRATLPGHAAAALRAVPSGHAIQAPRMRLCSVCQGARGRMIVNIERGEEWQECDHCLGEGKERA